MHFGQVLPIEDVAAILAITGQVVRLPCVCRTVLEKKEKPVCYLLAASPDRLGLRELIGKREEAAPFVAGMERVSPAAALAQMTALEDQGAIHTVWTFITPFIGAICNCDPSGCLAVNYTRRGLPTYFPGERRRRSTPRAAPAAAPASRPVSLRRWRSTTTGLQSTPRAVTAAASAAGAVRRRRSRWSEV